MLNVSQSRTTEHESNGARTLLESVVPAMARVLRLAQGVAPTPATILMTGASGTGKEVLARFIHRCSERGDAPFVAINCGAIAETLAESELFGHERGAFSGAFERRIGWIEAANGGTLLLDEISEMPLPLQTRLLRVLQEREVTRVGGSRPIPVDVRVIATSNRDLRLAVQDGTFREDLYYRLNVFPIHVPPLQRRKGDIPALAQVLCNDLAERFGRDWIEVSPSAIAALMSWSWPGNVRELRNTIERALILTRGETIEAEHIVLERDLMGVEPEAAATAAVGPRSLREREQAVILEVLQACNGNRTHAARELGISVRTLRNRLRDYRDDGLEIPNPARMSALDETTGLAGIAAAPGGRSS
ncbi:MAG: sigma-54-dependent Fis family transcriptional regulator [Deltaproteobacteria bacterium]|nr:sigma-54-dependent Fis family transcriptional regulator [Deltaproteobacteria bacterium]